VHFQEKRRNIKLVNSQPIAVQKQVKTPLDKTKGATNCSNHNG